MSHNNTDLYSRGKGRLLWPKENNPTGQKLHGFTDSHYLKVQKENTEDTQKRSANTAEIGGNRTCHRKASDSSSDLWRRAAGVIQNCYRNHLRLKCLKMCSLVCQIQLIRNSAAVHIQKHIRGYLVKKHFVELKNPLVLTWKEAAGTVQVSGSFTSPEWEIRVSFEYSRYFDEFYTVYLLENLIPPGRYYLKFIVDGDWVCHKGLPVFQDVQGNFNNYICVPNQPKSFPRKNLNNNFKEKLTVKIEFSGYGLAHPALNCSNYTLEGSADAWFFDTELSGFGIADGVGEWEDYGLDPSRFPRELLANCRAQLLEYSSLLKSAGELEIPELLEDILYKSCRAVKSCGSSTVLLGYYKGSFLHILSLGDSSLLLLRNRDDYLTVAFKSVSQQHSFNCPYQLAHLPVPGDSQCSQALARFGSCSQDSPFDGESATIGLCPGDLLIVATDGLFDNLYDRDILEICESFAEDSKVLAIQLVRAAIEKSQDIHYISPFAKSAAMNRLLYRGGKPDDSTVIVGIVS